MFQEFTRKWAIAATVLAAVCVVIVGALAQSQPPTDSGVKTTDQVFKNIQILKGVPADQLMPTMGFISASLGVGCDHCHVAGAPEKDDKDPKLFAREMMKMMFAINKNNFEGKREVTCYSCHHGERDPVSVPVITAEEVKPAKPVPAPKLTAQETLDKYVQALGGADAVQKISSRVEKGKTTTFGGRQFPLEVFTKGPGKWASYLHLPPGDNATIFDGQGGWIAIPGRPVRELSAGDLDAARLDADLQFPLTIKQTFTELKLNGTEKIDGHDTLVVTGQRTDLPPISFYFDQQSGLLVREVRYHETPLGHFPTQIDYSDYRDSGGTKVPFQRVVARPGMRFVTQLEEVQNNVPIDDAKFAKPPEPPPAAPPATK
jgi:photosynthetic reaction center cytochrome c subunit